MKRIKCEGVGDNDGFFEMSAVPETMHNTKLKTGDIVQFNTTCTWNRCSGVVTNLLFNLVHVTLPGGMRLAFGYHEVEFYCKGA